MNTTASAIWHLGVLACALTVCNTGLAQSPTATPDVPTALSAREQAALLRFSPLGPAPADPTNRVADDMRAARLGHALFFDRRLSSNGQVSCANCHDPQQGFADGKALSEGLGRGTRHSPSLWNVAYNRWYFWDGRADTLWSQAVQPIESERELGSTRLTAAHMLFDDPRLKAQYETLFGALPNLSDLQRFPATARPVPEQPQHPHHLAWVDMTPEDQHAVNRVYVHMAKSIAAYQRQLLTRQSPFDRFVKGVRSGDPSEASALSPSALRGFKLFIGDARCHLCHHGPNFTDGEFHDTRVRPLSGGRPRDAGRYQGADLVQRDPFNAAGQYSDAPDSAAARKLSFLHNTPENWGLFKTPTLRNVALSPPYMHQGQMATLRDVIEHYSTLDDAVAHSHHPETILVPVKLRDVEITDLIAFLESLTDTNIDPAWLAPPTASGSPEP